MFGLSKLLIVWRLVMVVSKILLIIFVVFFSLFSVGFCFYVDGFEDGNYDANPVWVPTGGTWGVNTNNPHTGSYSVYGTVGSSPSHQLKVNISSVGGNVVNYTVWLKITTANAAGVAGLWIYEGDVAKYYLKAHYAGFYKGWYFDSDASCHSKPKLSSTEPSTNHWYYLVIQRKVSENKARAYVYDSDGTTILLDSGDLTDSCSSANINKIGLFSQDGTVYYDDVNIGEMNATELEGRNAIEEGIHSSVLGPSAVIYTDQKLYIYNGTHKLGTFDKVVKTNNQVWAFNYITSGENYQSMKNLTNVIYFWEQGNMSYSEIKTAVGQYINNTKQ
ncbi:Uncharacterised protein [Candidatus Tiddalikarchaeum anstoanum]|nr:Uncharacterised protein [Candidatus Tiddalikarchaeum anstoanum]